MGIDTIREVPEMYMPPTDIMMLALFDEGGVDVMMLRICFLRSSYPLPSNNNTMEVGRMGFGNPALNHIIMVW